MEIKFENRYKTTELMLREYVHKVACRNIELMSLGVAVLGIVGLIVAVANHDNILLAVVGVCLVIAVFTGMLTPQLMLKELRETSARLNNGKKCETVVRFGDHITMEEGTTSMRFEYSQIRKIYNLKQSYVLMLGKQNGIMLSKVGFTKGTFADFKVFIKQKTGKAG